MNARVPGMENEPDLSSLEDQEKYWDRVSGEKEFTIPFRLDLFSAHVGREEPILEVGCGYGRILAELHRAGFGNLTGLDFSQKMIQRGHSLHPHLDLRRCGPGGLPFPDRTFKAVILVAVLTCIAGSKDQRGLVFEAARVLKEDGLLYLSDFMINRDPRNVRRYEKFKDKYGTYGVFELPEGGIMRHHSREHILELTGLFHPLAFEPQVFTTMNGHRSEGFCFLGKKGRDRSAPPQGG
jgi:SAM-dependent methyltransferase